MSSVDWAAINEKLPFERTDEAKEKRRELFKQFDPNGNGYLSLAEVRIQRGMKYAGIPPHTMILSDKTPRRVGFVN